MDEPFISLFSVMASHEAGEHNPGSRAGSLTGMEHLEEGQPRQNAGKQVSRRSRRPVSPWGMNKINGEHIPFSFIPVLHYCM